MKSYFRQSKAYAGREWAYYGIKPRVIAEELLTGDINSDAGITDYKFFCFNGLAKCFKIDFDRFKEHHANYYDAEKNILDFGEVICPPKKEKIIEFPETLPEMKQLAEKLSKDIPFLRADFYDVDGKVYFGEMTFLQQCLHHVLF